MTDTDYIRIVDAELRYYLRIQNPEDLTDTEWAMRLKELEWIRTKEAKANANGGYRGG